eukprot:TRINITY_DN18497_c0_g1_i3.p1 TRINITY_DN18497_c0_g1~~TRINITY_DN18497_c0_g1_i3.p1  ORF type:complete len:380 (-),score=80.51 TRINITY_DN18497_c0_g1_i3:306-1277(-)
MGGGATAVNTQQIGQAQGTIAQQGIQTQQPLDGGGVAGMQGMGNQIANQGQNTINTMKQSEGQQFGDVNNPASTTNGQEIMTNGGGGGGPANPPQGAAQLTSTTTSTPGQGTTTAGIGITTGPGSQSGGPGLPSQGASVYVANLSWWTTDEEIERICTEYGKVLEVTFFEEKANGKSKGVAQVQFSEAKAAMLCRDGLSGKMIIGRACVVTFPQQNKPYGYNPNFKFDKRFSQFHEGRGGGFGGRGRGRWGGGGYGGGMEGDMGMMGGGGHMGMMGGRGGGGMMDGGMGWGGPGNYGVPYGMGGYDGGMRGDFGRHGFKRPRF